jgi:drug/metabolite transporter (DMT)-like permease
VFTAPIVLLTGFGVLLCLYLRLATCDESCDASGSWHRNPDAWQWNLFLLLAVAGGVAAVVLLAAVLETGTRVAAIALVTWAICAVALATLLRQLGYRHQGATGWFGIAILTLLGVIAIAFADGRAPRGAQPSTE